MSQYVIIIIASHTRKNLFDGQLLYRVAITTSSNPQIGLQRLQDFSPIDVSFYHAIKADNRSDHLIRTFQIKYQASLVRSFWYDLPKSELDFLKTINEDNLTKVQGLIHKQLAPPPIPDQELPNFIQEQLALCKTLTNSN